MPAPREKTMPITIRQTHAIETTDIAAVISAHYKELNVPVEPSQITHQVFDGTSGGFSSSGPRLGDTTIRFFGKGPVGMPDSMVLKEDAVRAIVAQFLGRQLGLTVHPGSLRVKVSGSGGSGFSQTRASLDSISLHTTITV